MRTLRATDPGFESDLRALCARVAELPAEVESAARAIVLDVKRRGDVAVREQTLRLEGRALEAFELPRPEWERAAAGVKPAVREALQRAANRIRTFHEREREFGPKSFSIEEPGVRLGCRVTPLARAGVYVPGGTARYPSTVLMTAIPAAVAGVPDPPRGRSAETSVPARPVENATAP